MNKRLRNKYAKIMLSLVVATTSLNTIAPSYLMAATAKAASVEKVGCATIKDTTISIDGIEMNDKKDIVVNITLERSSGLPEGITKVYINGLGHIDINGKKGMFWLTPLSGLNRVSHTQGKIQMRLNLVDSDSKHMKGVTLEQVKGIQMTLPIEDIMYIGKATALSKAFQEQLQKVTSVAGVSLDEAGLGKLKKDKTGEGLEAAMKVLPAKGLNVPVAEGGRTTVDNIGFVEGKLQIRTQSSSGEALDISVVNKQGKDLRAIGGGIDDTFIEVFDIKDASALAQATFKVQGSIVLASDEEVKPVNLVF